MGVAALVFLSCPRPELPVIVIPVIHFLQVSQHRGRGSVGKFRRTGGATGCEEQGDAQYPSADSQKRIRGIGIKTSLDVNFSSVSRSRPKSELSIRQGPSS